MRSSCNQENNSRWCKAVFKPSTHEDALARSCLPVAMMIRRMSAYTTSTCSLRSSASNSVNTFFMQSSTRFFNDGSRNDELGLNNQR